MDSTAVTAGCGLQIWLWNPHCKAKEKIVSFTWFTVFLRFISKFFQRSMTFSNAEIWRLFLPRFLINMSLDQPSWGSIVSNQNPKWLWLIKQNAHGGGVGSSGQNGSGLVSGAQILVYCFSTSWSRIAVHPLTEMPHSTRRNWAGAMTDTPLPFRIHPGSCRETCDYIPVDRNLITWPHLIARELKWVFIPGLSKVGFLSLKSMGSILIC